MSESSRAPDTESLLAKLDKHRHARGTVPIFDALLNETVEVVSLELSRAPMHPLRPELTAWLRARGQAPSDLPSPDQLLLAELEERLEAQEKRIRTLTQEVETLSGLGLMGRRVNEVYAAMTALFVGISILGWMAAFGLLPFTPEGPTPLKPENAKVEAPPVRSGGSH